MTNELSARLTALTRDLILIASTDSRPEEREHCFEFIQNHLDTVEGIQYHRFESNGYESWLAAPTSTTEPEILLCGHIDVIDHPQPNCFHSRIRDGRIYGPGAGDMKGSDAILIELFRTLHGFHPGISLGLLLTSDEERGGTDGVQFLCQQQGLRCGVAIIPDGGSLNDVTVEEKGVLQARLRQSGHEAHAARPWLGRNALELLIQRTTRLTDHFAQFWPLGDIVEQENHWFPTCVVANMQTPNTTWNRIPADAEAVIDIRFPPPATVESMQRELRRLVGSDCEIETLMSAEPTKLNPDPLFCTVTAEMTGQPVRLVKASGASDSRFFRQHGIPVNLSRPLVGNLHAIDEWIEISSMTTYFEICKSYIERKLVLKTNN